MLVHVLPSLVLVQSCTFSTIRAQVVFVSRVFLRVQGRLHVDGFDVCGSVIIKSTETLAKVCVCVCARAI